MRLLSVFSCVFLCACSTISYVEPTAGDRSKVRVATDSKSGTSVRGYENADCEGAFAMMTLRDGFLANSAPKSLDMPLNNFHKNANKEFYFESGKDHYLMFFGGKKIGNTFYSCAVPIAAKFDADKDYEVSYISGITSCTVEVFELVGLDGGYSRNLLKTFTNRGTIGCAAEAKKRSRL